MSLFLVVGLLLSGAATGPIPLSFFYFCGSLLIEVVEPVFCCCCCCFSGDEIRMLPFSISLPLWQPHSVFEG